MTDGIYRNMRIITTGSISPDDIETTAEMEEGIFEFIQDYWKDIPGDRENFMLTFSALINVMSRMSHVLEDQAFDNVVKKTCEGLRQLRKLQKELNDEKGE
jgi:hypothetical protein